MGEGEGGKVKPEESEGRLRDLLGEEGTRAFLESEAYAAAEAALEGATGVGEFLDSPAFAEGLNAFLAAMLVKAVQESPEKVAVVARVLGADARAAEFARRYREEGVRISYGEAVELAFGLMWMRTPYQREAGEQRPADDLAYIYDYEILAAKALMERDGHSVEKLVERSDAEKLAWDALQECVKSKLRAQETVEGELLEWALEAAAGMRTRPYSGRDQTTEMRDALIVETVEALVACGLTRTRRHWPEEPRCACDAVAEVLGMEDQAVRKVSDRAACATKVRPPGPTTG